MTFLNEVLNGLFILSSKWIYGRLEVTFNLIICVSCVCVQIYRVVILRSGIFNSFESFSPLKLSPHPPAMILLPSESVFSPILRLSRDGSLL